MKISKILLSLTSAATLLAPALIATSCSHEEPIEAGFSIVSQTADCLPDTKQSITYTIECDNPKVSIINSISTSVENIQITSNAKDVILDKNRQFTVTIALKENVPVPKQIHMGFGIEYKDKRQHVYTARLPANDLVTGKPNIEHIGLSVDLTGHSDVKYTFKIDYPVEFTSIVDVRIIEGATKIAPKQAEINIVDNTFDVYFHWLNPPSPLAGAEFSFIATAKNENSYANIDSGPLEFKYVPQDVFLLEQTHKYLFEQDDVSDLTFLCSLDHTPTEISSIWLDTEDPSAFKITPSEHIPVDPETKCFTIHISKSDEANQDTIVSIPPLIFEYNVEEQGVKIELQHINLTAVTEDEYHDKFVSLLPLENGTITLVNHDNPETGLADVRICDDISKAAPSWKPMSANEPITLTKGKRVYLEGHNKAFYHYQGDLFDEWYNILHIDCRVSVSGDITTLLNENGLDTLGEDNKHAFQNLFGYQGITSEYYTITSKIVKVSDDFIKPNIGQGYAFSYTFVNNPYLEYYSPDILCEGSTTYQNECNYMFCNCTSLIEGPKKLAAENSTIGCYMGMFANCVSLAHAPEICLTGKAVENYEEMFYNCWSLQSIKIHYAGDFTDDQQHSFINWVYGVGPNGVLYYNGSDRTYGKDAIPEGWTVEPF